MAMTLAAQIESYIKRLLALSADNSVELSRADLAQMFMCVPSQINYVLNTRFNTEAGYYIETRRGGSGYVRIWRSFWRLLGISHSVGRRRITCWRGCWPARLSAKESMLWLRPCWLATRLSWPRKMRICCAAA